MTAKIMTRKGKDDFEAYLVAQGMEDAGAQVISIAYDGEHQQYGAMIPCSKFTVWARVPDGVNIDDVDTAIDAQIDSITGAHK